MPNANLYSEGLEFIYGPGTYGLTLEGMTFADSDVIDSAYGNNSLVFSGYDADRNVTYDYNTAISGMKSYPSQIMTFNTPDCPITNFDNNCLFGSSSTIDTRSPTTLYGTPNFVSLYNITYASPPDAPAGYGITTQTGNVSISSINKIGVLDLICEGPIEGFVTGNYFYDYSGRTTGDIGYRAVTFVPFTSSGYYGGSEDGNTYLEAPPEARSIFWNDTPIVDSNGYFNFKSVNFKYSYSQPDMHVKAHPTIDLYEDRYDYWGRLTDKFKYPLATSRSKGINERLYGAIITTGQFDVGFPKIYYFYNKEISSIKINIKINSLFQTIMATGAGNAGDSYRETLNIGFLLYRVFSNGDLTLVDSSQFWPYIKDYYYNENVFLKGKVSQSPMLTTFEVGFRPYAENFPFIQLLQNQIGWAVSVVKTTQEGLPPGITNSTSVDSVTEVYSDRFVYPNTAMVYNEFDSRYFSSVPTRSYKMRLLKVKIPNNYDPILRNYSGFWDGRFKLAWTDNPAWCYYDLISNNRYGLGKYINTDLIDKWNLYEIAQYCDQLVPNGKGGLEPRFTCNLMIAAKEEAYKVLNDMASIFRGITYYSAGQIFAAQDRPKNPIYAFNNSNVVDGRFSYSDSSRRVRKTVAVVRYNDEDNNYKPAVEYIEYRQGIIKYGIRETAVTAFGCTNKNQAIRLGKWFLITENEETETVNFDAGLEASYLLPGDIIQLYDQHRSNVSYAGRTKELTTGSATLDLSYNTGILNTLTGFRSNFDIYFLTPTYNLQYGTDLGDNYITGYNITNSGVTGLNSNFFRRSEIQKITIPLPTQNYITSGTGYYSDNIRINFPAGSGLNSGEYSLMQNAIWNIDVNVSGYTGIDIRSPINNPNNIVYPGALYDGNLNEPTLYRVLNIKENTEKSIYNISAIEYVPQKYGDIDLDAKLTNVGIKPEIPQAPRLILSGLYRDAAGNLTGSNKLLYQGVQSPIGINSIAYSVQPPLQFSQFVTQYLVYMRTGLNFTSQILDVNDLIDVLPPNVQTGFFPTGANSRPLGIYPPMVTPLKAGNTFFRVFAKNSLDELSPMVTGFFNLTSQAPMDRVLASGVNVEG
jgi:hypothetical protein